jgi:CubicO group peptidase (beta-lactamase class C family)
LRQLLNHAAGLVTDDPWADRQLDMSESDFSRLLGEGIPLARDPGEAFEYSNMGYALLGRAISNASGLRYQDYVTQILIQPLGMASTVWEPRKAPEERRAVGYSWVDDHLEEEPLLSDGAFAAAAGLNSTAKDFARYVAWLLSAWSAEHASRPAAINTALIREAGRGSILSQAGERPGGPDGKDCPVAWMYGAGFYVVTDCELATMLRHPGGLPGFGSQLLLLPQDGVGIFAFSNLTYAHLSDPVVAAAVLLKRAGLLDASAPQVSPALARAANIVLRIYQAGDVEAGRAEFAANLLQDVSSERRNAQLRRARESTGACASIAPAAISHALAGRFRLACERGSLEVMIALAPTTLPKIQYFEFQPNPAP